MSDLYIGNKANPKIDISSATVTLASSSFTYDGATKTQAISSVTLGGKMLVNGTDYTVIGNSKVNAGNYTLKINGIGKYEGSAVAGWSIAKAIGSISVSSSSVDIQGAGTTETVTVSKTGDGVVGVNSSNSAVATASVSGNTVSITSVGRGSATITATLAAGMNYTGDSATISVSVVTISLNLSECTPAEIQQAAQEGIASALWSVGAMTAPISIGAVGNMSATSVRAFIIGFDHNSSKEGTGIHFEFGKNLDGLNIAFCDSGYSGGQKTFGTWFNMNNTRTNSSGWNGSRMRTVICPAFKSALPSVWQSVIATTTKYTDNTGGGSDTASYVTATADDIFLLAEYEVFGARAHANSAEQNYQLQYDYYKNGNSKIKCQHNATTSTTCSWWLRSPNADYNKDFCNVDTSGSASSGGAFYSLGFTPGFRIA